MVRTLIFVPCYNCAPQLQRITPNLVNIKAPIFFIDNASSDQTQVYLKDHVHTRSNQYVVSHHQNYGLGGSFKTAIEIAREQQCEWIIWFHGDDQASLKDLSAFLKLCQDSELDAIFGARFHPHSKRFNYSLIRTLGNQALNTLASLVLKRRVYELGSGLNAFRVSALDEAQVALWPNHIAFDMNLLFYFVSRDRYLFTPIEWHERDQVSNARNIRVGLDVLKMLFSWWRTKKLELSKENEQNRSYSTYPNLKL